MALVICNAGENWMCDKILASNLTLRLYTNDYTCVPTSTKANFTEATGTWYAAKTLTGGSWTAAATNGSGQAESSYATQSWTLDASASIYGYYVTDPANSDALVYAERFGAVRNLTSGDDLNVTPKFTLYSQN